MRYVGLTIAALLLAAAARGDVVHLKNGGALEGQVTVTQDGAIIKLPVGEVRVSNDAIARIEKKETPLEDYLKRAAAVKEDDAEGHYKLGVWAQTVGLKPQAKDEFSKTIALKPDHEGARQALGYRKVGGQWMTLEQEMQARGLILRDGDWMTPEAAAKLDALKAELEAAKAKRAAAEAEANQAPAQPAYTYEGYYATRPGYSYYNTWPYSYAPYWPYYTPYYSFWPRTLIIGGRSGGHHFSGPPHGGHSGGHSGGPHH